MPKRQQQPRPLLQSLDVCSVTSPGGSVREITQHLLSCWTQACSIDHDQAPCWRKTGHAGHLVSVYIASGK